MRPAYGSHEITPAEQRIIDELMQGKTNADIAASLKLTVKTVKFHLTHIFKKRSVYGRSQFIVSEAKRRAHVPAPPPPIPDCATIILPAGRRA